MLIPASALPPQPASPESGAWDHVRAGWRLIYGGLALRGVSVEVHEFSSEDDLDWSRSFHPDSIELCLNLTGTGQIHLGKETRNVAEGSASAYAMQSALQASRPKGEQHRFVTLEFRRDYLADQLAGRSSAVERAIRGAILAKKPRDVLGWSQRLSGRQLSLVHAFTAPPVPTNALPLWFEAKILECVAEFLFEPNADMFCHRQQRLAEDRVARAKEILDASLENPPSLEELGRAVGVSPFYLSRTFSSVAGMTIPKYIRRIRMERAANLLREGGHNVTEAAFAVGYSSLGHFSKAFCEEMGCCPTLYPQAKALMQSARKGAATKR